MEGLIFGILRYVTAAWDPYRQNQMEKLKADLSREVRFIKRYYDYNTRVSKLKKSLSSELVRERRKSHRVQIFQKLVYNDITLPVPPYYNPSIRETTNHSTSLFIQRSVVHHDYDKYSFFPRTKRDLNCLLPETRAINYSAFCRAKLSKIISFECSDHLNYKFYLIFYLYLYFCFLTLLDV